MSSYTIPSVVEKTVRAASARSTSTAGCSPTGSSTSAPRSTTASPTSSSPSCSTWSRTEPGVADRPLPQLPGRLGDRDAGDLRHDAVHQLAGRYDGDRPGRLVGRRAAGRGRPGPPDRAAALAGGAAPAVGRRPGHAARPRAAGQGDRPAARARWRRSWPGTPAATVEQIREDTDRDLVLSAQEAVDYGLGGRDPRQPEIGARSPLNST